MKSRSIVLFALILVVGLLAVSCDQLFENQLVKYQVVTPPAAPDAATVKAMTSDQIVETAYKADGTLDPVFIATLEADTTGTTTTAVLDTLDNNFSSADPAVVQQSAILYTQVKLETSGAAAIVDNIPTVVGTITTALQNNETLTTNQIVDAILPAALTSSRTVFDDAINAFSSLSSTSLATLGTSLNAAGTVADAGQAAVAGEIAVIGAIITKIQPSLITDPATSSPYTSVNDVLWDLVDPSVSVKPVLNASSINLPATTMADLKTADPSLYALVNAAALGGLYDTLAGQL